MIWKFFFWSEKTKSKKVFFKNYADIRTVAGDATSKSMGSKIKLVVGASAMISPLFRHNFRLSSSTVFMFSIHTASTGPSNINHFLSGVYKILQYKGYIFTS